jgi:hypothetical protein
MLGALENQVLANGAVDSTRYHTINMASILN